MEMISKEDRNKVYDYAAVFYGKKNQTIVAIEEMAECVKELTKALRHDIRPAALAEEVADALICLEQMQRMFKIEDCVASYMDSKVKRLADNIARDFPPCDGGLKR